MWYFWKMGERKEVIMKQPNENQLIYDDLIYGRNAVLELLKSEKDINKIFIERGEKHGSIKEDRKSVV